MGDNKILVMTKEEMVKQRINNKTGIKSGLYFGDKDYQSSNTEPVVKSNGDRMESTVIGSTPLWEGSEGYSRLWNQIEDAMRRVKNKLDRKVNINQFPDDYYDLIDLMRIDITRRRIQEEDYTPLFTREVTNPNFSKAVSLLEFLPFAGVFEEIKVTGDNVPMLQQKTGAKGSVDIELYGLGHARSLEDELYNLDIYSIEKVNTAVARAHTARRNNICFNPLIALTNSGGWHASQTVPADTTTGATYDVKLYLTIRNAIRTLMGLLDPQTQQEINVPRMVLLVRNNVIQWDLSRVLGGQLQRFGQPVENREALAINEVWRYIGDTIDVGPKRWVFPGVPENTAYLFVPGPAGAPNWTLSKRQLTQEVGRGDVLTLARERRAWYFGQGEYREEFLGSSSATLGLGSGYGYVVTIDLPDFDEET